MRLALSILLLTASTAAAQPSKPPAPEPEREPVDHYGWKIMISDAIFVTAAAIGIYAFVRNWEESDTSPDAPPDGDGGSDLANLSVIGVVGYLAVPPVIHGANRNGRGAAKSLFFRFILPVVGMAAGKAVGGDHGDGEEIAAGAALGATTALFMDWLAFAQRRRPTSAYTPAVTPVRGGGMTFGIAGSF